MTTAVPVAHSAHQLPRRADYRLTIDGSQHSHTSIHPGRAGAVGALADYAEGPGFELTATQTTDTSQTELPSTFVAHVGSQITCHLPIP